MRQATAAENHIGSILMVDCGTVMTRATLLDRVEGVYRIISWGEAPTTRGEPWRNVADGVRHAVEQISGVTGRHFFGAGGDLITPQVSSNRGVDAFASTISASDPLELTLGGLTAEWSIASARRAAAGTYTQITSSLNDSTGLPLTGEACVRAIRDAAPDVVFIAGGIEGGADKPVLGTVRETVLACSTMDRDERPVLLYAGNYRLRRQVVGIVGNEAELRVVENVRPSLAEEDIADAQQELESLFVERRMNHLSGMSTIDSWSSVPPAPTAQAFGRLIQYLWHLGAPDRGVIGIDVGGANTAIAAVFDDELHLTVHAGLGSSFGGARLMQPVGERNPEAVVRWVPEPLSRREARGLLINKEAYPASVPQVPRDLWVEQALAREAISETLAIARPGWRPGAAQVCRDLLPLCDTIVIAGGILARAPRAGQVVLIVLDSLQPIGITTLVLDRYGLAHALGNVARVKPLAAVEALDAGSLTNLGTVIAPIGEAEDGKAILEMDVTYENRSRLHVDVHQGDLEILPLPVGEEAILEIYPRPNIDAGLGGEGQGGKRRVSGGVAGLIIDARGRPLRPSRYPEKRREQMQQWLWAAGG